MKCKSLNSHFASFPGLRSTMMMIIMAFTKHGKLGLNKGIHTVIIGKLLNFHSTSSNSIFYYEFLAAVTSCNDVIAIFLFGVLLGIAFSTGNLTHQLLQGPVGIVLGCIFGAVSGLVILKFPSDKSVRIFISFHLS